MVDSKKSTPRRRWRQWREADAREALTAGEQSGMSLQAFARSRDLSPSRLLRWKKRLASPDAVRFVAVTPPAASAGVIEVAARGLVVRVSEDIAAPQLTRLLAAVLAALPPC